MLGPWTPQMYGIVPATVNVTVRDSPDWMNPVSNAPLFALALWTAASLFVQVMLSPTLIVRVCGTNWKFAMVTVAVAPFGIALAFAAPRRNSAMAAIARRTARII